MKFPDFFIARPIAAIVLSLAFEQCALCLQRAVEAGLVLSQDGRHVHEGPRHA